MRETITIIVISLLVGCGFTWWVKPAEVIDRTNYEQERIDSLTTVIRNRQATNESLKDSLKNTAASFQKYIDEHQGQVATLTTLRGKLNTQIDELEDSLKSAQSDFDVSFLCNQEQPDSTIEYTRTFSDDLLRVTSYNHFRNSTFNDSLSLKPMRDIRIDLALLVSDDRRTVESIATSKDLDSLRVSAQTQIEPPKRKLPWTVLVGIGAGLVKVAELIFK